MIPEVYLFSSPVKLVIFGQRYSALVVIVVYGVALGFRGQSTLPQYVVVYSVVEDSALSCITNRLSPSSFTSVTSMMLWLRGSAGADYSRSVR